MESIPVKSIISKMSGGDQWFGYDYNMNLYRGCSHGCIYCDSRSNCYHINNFDTVRVKQNALEILEKELRCKRSKGVVGIGAMSDSYNPFEKQQLVTRGALELLERYEFGVAITTKSNLIVRDIDIFKRMVHHSSVITMLTITAAEDAIAKKIERNVVESSLRFKAIEELSRAGIYTGILMTPILPYITDTEQNIKGLVHHAAMSGAKFLYNSMGVTLRENQRLYYYDWLDRLYPGMKNKYQQRFGNCYICESEKAAYLQRILREECDNAGIIYRMKDIIHNYKKDPVYEQLSMKFER